MSYGDHAHDEEHEHVTPLPTYFGVFGALMILTVITVGVSYLGLGAASIYVAMFVAIIKAYMVCAYFMHLKWDNPFNRLVFLSSILFMGIFFVITASDLGYRGRVNPETDTMVLRQEEANRAADEARKSAAEQKRIELIRPAGQIPNGADPSPMAPPRLLPSELPPPKAPEHH